MQIRLFPFVKKETLHILRDKRTLLVVLCIPVLLVLLFGFTVSTDIRNVKVAVCAPHRCDAVRQSVDRLVNSPYFRFEGYVDGPDIDKTLRTGKATAVVVMATDYATSGKMQIVVDGSDVNTATTTQLYLQNVLMGQTAHPVEMHTLYNPQMLSSYNFVPGIMGMIFLLICCIMTSVSIVKEKEMGTMEVLLVSPVKPFYIILSKMVPYFLISCIGLVLILLLARFALGIPLSGGVVSIVVVSLVYLILSLAMGLLVSNIANSQLVALLISAIVMMMPVLFFSGLLFPLENIPWALRWIGYVHPSRWYIDALRKLMIEGVPFRGVLMEFGIISAEALLLVVAGTRKFNDRLE